MAKILVVDDVRFIVEMVASIFRNQGHEVFTAENGPAALEAAQRETPDLVLLDVTMPGMDGVQVASRLREDPRTAATPILLVTSQSDQQNIARAAQAGVNDYVAKPFEPAVLLGKAAQLLGGYRMNFSVQSIRGIAVVSVLRNDVDQSIASELDEALSTASSVEGPFVLDISRVTKVDQAAADLVVRHAAERSREGRPMRVVQPGRGVGTRTLAVRLGKHAHLHEAREKALRDAGANGVAHDAPLRSPALPPSPAPVAPAAAAPPAPAPPAPAAPTGPACIIDSLGSVIMVRVRGPLAKVLPEILSEVAGIGGRTVLLTASIAPDDVAALSELVTALRSGGRVLRIANADAGTRETLESVGIADLVVQSGATRASS